MGSLHLYLSFCMEFRARAPSIRFRLLPTRRTFHLLVPPISMLQQHLPQQLSHQLPPLLRQLARDLIKTRFRMLFPLIPHRLKYLLRTSHKLRLRLFPIHLSPPLSSLFSYLKSTALLPLKRSGIHPDLRGLACNWTQMGFAGSAGGGRRRLESLRKRRLCARPKKPLNFALVG